MHGGTLGDGSRARPSAAGMWSPRGRMARFGQCLSGRGRRQGSRATARAPRCCKVNFAFAFMPHLPEGKFTDTKTIISEVSSKSFWLKRSAWQCSDHRTRGRSWTGWCVMMCYLAIRSWTPCCEANRRRCLPARCATISRRLRGLSQGRARQVEHAQVAAAMPAAKALALFCNGTWCGEAPGMHTNAKILAESAIKAIPSQGHASLPPLLERPQQPNGRQFVDDR